MTTDRSVGAALDPRISTFASATALETVVLEVADLLLEARDRIVAAEQLAERLRRDHLVELDRLIDPALVEKFRRSMVAIDSSEVTVGLKDVDALGQALYDLGSDLRQDLYDSLGDVGDDAA